MKNEYDIYTVTLAYMRRPYHNLDHLVQVRQALGEFIEIDKELEVTIDLHDVVCKPGSADNEALSADIAADLYPEYEAFVREAIMATKRHEATGNRKIDLFLDADMSVIGLPWPEYDKYRKAIRKEYSAYSDEEFREGRMKFLRSFSGFITEEFNHKYLEQAKYNIRRELNEFNGIFIVIKPRGTSSVLQNVSSGIQPRYETDYIRNFTWEP